MKTGSRAVQFSLKHPRVLTLLIVMATFICGALATTAVVDTDPENMLKADEPARVFHKRVKEEFALYDMVVIGIANEEHPDGVFNPVTLGHVQELTEFIRTLADPDDPSKRVISADIIAPGNIDNIRQDGPGQVRFEWLMAVAPREQKEALAIRDAAMNNPLIKGTMVSEDGKAICIYAPVSSKSFADQVRTAVLGKLEAMASDNGDRYYITGLPVAEDTFGREILLEMMRVPPFALAAIFLLMLLFFRQIKLIISPLMVAMFSVVCTMGLLNASGFTFHIMSSMIPIFLMPIAIVDSIHILSDFYDNYHKFADRRKAIEHVMDQLFIPMLYTSLTSAAGFASLALAPIPPIRVFGVFVALGIMLAWLFTILFIPAYIMMLKEETLVAMAKAAGKLKGETGAEEAGGGVLARVVRGIGQFAFARPKTIVACTAFLFVVAAVGITKIQSNDNPMNWFVEDHPIRVADRVLNDHFAGTYELYLVLSGNSKKLDMAAGTQLIKESLAGALLADDRGVVTSELGRQAEAILSQEPNDSADFDAYLATLISRFEEELDAAADEDGDGWGLLLASLESVRDRGQIFKDPAVLRYVADLQAHLLSAGGVGKSNSVTDVVKKVHQELFESDPAHYRVPNSRNGVAETLISYQNSHKPGDLWHFVTPDYAKANIWVQLQDGDNQTAAAVVRGVQGFMADNPPPVLLEAQWAGLSYINIVWQDKMVSGMGKALISSFLIVFVMMVILFRSVLFGFLAMLPLSVTIVFMYGFIGWIGKDYDMPVAVLSSLTLGLAVDFAIHFLQRARDIFARTGSWASCSKALFEEPARAISRNIIVIAVGFVPLLFSILNPYQTVGILFAAIMGISGLCTLLLLSACMTLMRGMLFAEEEGEDEVVLGSVAVGARKAEQDIRRRDS
ncbi:MAG: MMPL family transporter [Thermodesulfobacteriota bacterium]